MKSQMTSNHSEPIDHLPRPAMSEGALKAIVFFCLLGGVAFILYLWAGASEQRINTKLNAPIVRAQQLAATPGYSEGRALGYDVGLAGAGLPKDWALVKIGQIHAEKHGHKYDDKWVEAFGRGYRAGIIAAQEKLAKDREQTRTRW